jgi:glycosyltransferase involved in cell wall biosynthesis
MRVTLCVDALEPQPGGIGRYTLELCKGLAEQESVSKLFFFARNCLLDNPDGPSRGQGVRQAGGVIGAYRAWQTSRTLRSTLVHGTNYFLPRAADTGIITVHDLSVFKYPETHPSTRVQAFERLFSSSVERATQIITDTETVRRELIEGFAVRAESVTVVPLGVGRRFKPHDTAELTPLLDQWGLTADRYGLCVSTLEPRKKVAELIAAWRQLPRRLRDTIPLVLAGGPGWRNDKLHSDILDAASEGWLKHLGFVHEAHLPKLYAGARLFIYPSVYEGFGLPPIEAMASGTPVVVANRSCLPEVCGDAVSYVDPDNITDFAFVLECSLSDVNWRSEALKNGLLRAREFTWERCVAETTAVYGRA